MRRMRLFRHLGFCIILSSMVFLTSCAYDSEFERLNDQIVSLNRRVTKLQETIDSSLDKRLDTAQSNQARIQVEIDQLKEKVSGLSGQVEDNEHLIKRTVERDLSEEDALQAGVAALSQKVTELEIASRQHSEYLGLESLSTREEQKSEKKAEVKEEARAEQVRVKGSLKSNDLELYDISMAYFKNGKYEEAVDSFKEYLQKYPKSDRADNAQFWIGECYMAFKQYEQAILAYQEVIKRYPKGNKVPNALLRQAIAFLEIKDKTSSKLLLKKIIKKYPKSNEAKIARVKLKTI